MTIEEMKKKKAERGYSNEKLAELSGVPLSTIQKIFSGITRQPRYETILALESVLSDGFGGCIGGGGSKVAETMFEYNGKKQGEYTIDDYCQLPDDMRFELIDGRLYYMTAPFTPHQVVSGAVWRVLDEFIRKNKGKCIPFTAPVDVHLLKDGKTMVQPDIIVLCDIIKLTEKRIEGAPDFVAEILSPSTRRKDMTLKLSKYTEAGVREYWIIDYKEKKVIVYDIENDALPQIYGFRDKVPVAIFDGRCQVDFAEIDDTLEFYFGDKE